MMTTKEELREIFNETSLRLSLKPKDPRSRLFGEWDSRFIGDGMEFDQFREFRSGDDPKHINAPMSSRFGKQIVTRYNEPREARCLIVLDVTPSMKLRDKIKTAFAALSMIFYSAYDAHMPVSIWMIGDKKEFDMRPPVTPGHMDMVIDAICGGEDDNPYLFERASDLNLDNWQTSLPGGSFVFLISDFIGDSDTNFRQFLTDNLYRYHAVPVVVQDDMECTFPNLPSANIVFGDPETGSSRVLRIDKETAAELREQNENRFSDITKDFSDRFMLWAHVKSPDAEHVHESIETALLTL